MYKRSDAGLTIIEVMMIGIVAAIAISLVIPRLRAARIVHNEELALTIVPRILAAEASWKGESGKTLRAEDEPSLRFAYLDELVETSLLDVPEGRLEGGRLIANGYVFEIVLFEKPQESRVPIERNPTDLVRVDPDRYLLLAWPEVYGQSGVRFFAADGQAIFHSSNSLHRYEGTGSRAPSGTAPLIEDQSQWLGHGKGQDDQFWGPMALAEELTSTSE
ncbi:MAG: hypothetical protein RL885_12515 [Planctomycetota bacterium]